MTKPKTERPIDSYSIWNSGQPLSRAFMWIENEPLAIEYRKVVHSPDYQAAQKQVKMIGVAALFQFLPLVLNKQGQRYLERLFSDFVASEPGNPFNTLLENARGPQEKMSAAGKKELELKKRLLASLRSGKHIAFGFESPRRLTDFPRPVPRDIFLGKVDWEENSLEANGLKIEGVRVLPENSSLTVVGKNGKVSQRGRPSRRSQIIEVFEELFDLGRISLANLDSQIIEAVIKGVMERYPNDEHGEKGLSPETVREILKPELKIRRPPQKS